MTWYTLVILVLVVVSTTTVGMWAARWRPGDLHRLSEWGIGGRRFGPLASWFVMGNSYLVFPLLLLPAGLYDQARAGYFTLPAAILSATVASVFLPRLWTLARHRGYVTVADFVTERFGSREAGLAVALTGIVATIPMLVLQWVAIETVASHIGLPVVPTLIIAFAIQAAFTFRSGVRASALLSIAAMSLVWIGVSWVALAALPNAGGIPSAFASHPEMQHFLPSDQYSAFASLSVEGALAVWLSPAAITGVFASNSYQRVQRNARSLLALPLLLFFFSLLPSLALSVGGHPAGLFNTAVPLLADRLLPGWAGSVVMIAFMVSALALLSMLSVAGANLFARNLYRVYIRPACPEREEGFAGKAGSLSLSFIALLCVFAIPPGFFLHYQFISTVFLLQTLPAAFIGLFTRWFHQKALLTGWATGTLLGIALSFTVNTSVVTLPFIGLSIPLSTGLLGLLVNLVICCAGTPVCHLLGLPDGKDRTWSIDYAFHPSHALKKLQWRSSEGNVPLLSLREQGQQQPATTPSLPGPFLTRTGIAAPMASQAEGERGLRRDVPFSDSALVPAPPEPLRTSVETPSPSPKQDGYDWDSGDGSLSL